MKVLIVDGLVREIFENQTPELHKDLLVVDAPDDIQEGYSYEDGVFSEPPVAEISYRERRRREYPSVGDQLDALFHAGVFPDWMDAKLQAVKDKYPKEADSE